MTRPDIDDAVKRMPKNFAVKGLVKKLPDEIRDDETVIAIASGTYDDKPALVVLTSARILFIGKWAFQSKSEDFPIGRVSSVELKTGVLMSDVVIYTSNQEARIKHLVNEEAKRFVAQAREAISTHSQPAPVSATADPAEQLLKLKQLLDAGIISGDEYETKRQQLLAQI
jgi:hypothetical protein